MPADVLPFVKRLVEARLLIRDKNVIEAALEGQLLQWPSLRAWLTEDLDKLGRLKDAVALLSTPGYAAADSDKRAYLNACTAAQQARDATLKEEQERQIRDAEQIAEEQKKAALAQQRTARNTRIGLLVALVLTILADITAFVAYNEKQAANTTRSTPIIERHRVSSHWGGLVRAFPCWPKP